jgi:predicted regulator of Ras-like GTPase activity (Roadblock/LC7/MglB family)
VPLSRRLETAAQAARGGAIGFLHLQASNGALFVAPCGNELLLIVIAGKGINVGRARLEMARVAEMAA